jgi:hypothetical protein
VIGGSTGIEPLTDSIDPTNIVVRDLLVTTSTEGGGLAPVYIDPGQGQPIAFSAVGSTFVGRGTSQAAVLVGRKADDSAPVTATLRNSVARDLAPGGADLLADRAGIGVDFSSFNTVTRQNGGTAPVAGSAHNVAGDPLLAADFSLQPGSPLIDRGDPAAVRAGELDFAGAARSLDGNGDCAAVPDSARSNARARARFPPRTQPPPFRASQPPTRCSRR